MAAVILNMFADQNRDKNISFVWFDREGERFPLNGYGAIAEIRYARSGALVSRITHTSGITLHTEEGSEGQIDLNFPAADSEDLDSLECVWELIVFPTAEEPETSPTSLVRGTLAFRPPVVEFAEEGS